MTIGPLPSRRIFEMSFRLGTVLHARGWLRSGSPPSVDREQLREGIPDRRPRGVPVHAIALVAGVRGGGCRQLLWGGRCGCFAPLGSSSLSREEGVNPGSRTPAADHHAIISR